MSTEETESSTSMAKGLSAVSLSMLAMLLGSTCLSVMMNYFTSDKPAISISGSIIHASAVTVS